MARSADSSESNKKLSAQQRLAAQRAAAANARARDAHRRRLLAVGTPIAVVIIAVAALVAVRLGTGGATPKSGQQASAASNSVIQGVTSVPIAALDTVGAGTVSTPPTAITGAPLTADGKPRVLYIGAEYCPYCATERWPVVVALSRFGAFSNLGQTASSPSDTFPNTATLTFHGATYTSSTVSFTGVETTTNQVVDGTYSKLDTPTPADQQIMSSLDPNGGIPFIDIGGKYLVGGASYDPQVLQGKTHAQIAAALADPTSAIAKGVDGTANMITAAICDTMTSPPAAVCQAPGVMAAAKLLPAAKS